jgi:hypothetical protein
LFIKVFDIPVPPSWTRGIPSFFSGRDNVPAQRYVNALKGYWRAIVLLKTSFKNKTHP